MPHSKNNTFTKEIAFKLVDIIVQRPANKLSLLDMAAISGYSPHYLKYLFKDHVGASIGRFIKDVYLDFAAGELMHTNEKIIVIALNAGYSSQQSFSRAFRNKYGFTPTEFKELTADRATALLKKVDPVIKHSVDTGANDDCHNGQHTSHE